MQNNSFIIEDLKREMVNRFPNGIADNYDDFCSRILDAVRETLNSPVGQDLIEPLRQDAIRTHMFPEAWQQKKVDIMVTMFFLAVDNLPMLKHELANHLYHELRKES
jgi:hypothetical protein